MVQVILVCQVNFVLNVVIHQNNLLNNVLLAEQQKYKFPPTLALPTHAVQIVISSQRLTTYSGTGWDNTTHVIYHWVIQYCTLQNN